MVKPTLLIAVIGANFVNDKFYFAEFCQWQSLLCELLSMGDFAIWRKILYRFHCVVSIRKIKIMKFA
jgi:hypothetical protein